MVATSIIIVSVVHQHLHRIIREPFCVSKQANSLIFTSINGISIEISSISKITIPQHAYCTCCAIFNWNDIIKFVLIFLMKKKTITLGWSVKKKKLSSSWDYTNTIQFIVVLLTYSCGVYCIKSHLIGLRNHKLSTNCM